MSGCLMASSSAAGTSALFVPHAATNIATPAREAKALTRRTGGIAGGKRSGGTRERLPESRLVTHAAVHRLSRSRGREANADCGELGQAAAVDGRHGCSVRRNDAVAHFRPTAVRRPRFGDVDSVQRYFHG